jgi:hypothetical protein
MQTNDDYVIRHRMSDMSVSQQQQQNILAPLEPNNTYESYSRRGSVTDPAINFRRPSITDTSNLPLPNSTVVSRRGSIATTTDYDYSSRSPSPSPYTFPFSSSKRGYHDEQYPYSSGRRDSLPLNQPLHPSAIATNNPVYDPYQRRHSIATGALGNNNNSSSSKYRGKQA